MQIELQTIVLPGHKIEIQSPELPVGSHAKVSIQIEDGDPPKRRIGDILKDYPGGRLFKTAEEVDAYIRAERDSWDN